MKRFRILRGVFGNPLLVLVLLISLPAAFANAELTKKQIEILETEFLPAYQQGNPLGVLESLNKVIRKMSDEQLAELDALLVEKEIPPSSELLLESRLMLLRQKVKRISPPRGRELGLLLQHIDDAIAANIEWSESLLLSENELAKLDSFKAFEDLIWDTHVSNQKLGFSIDLANYAAGLLKNKKRITVESLPAEQQKLLEVDFVYKAEQLQALRVELYEQDLAARVTRLNLARETLRNSTELEERYLAAWAVEGDSQTLVSELKAGLKGEGFEHDALSAHDLIEDVIDATSEARKKAGDKLLAKSRHLFEGLHWWYRGRYGKGTEGFGFLKGPAATVSSEAAFALFMPERPPVPTPPKKTGELNGGSMNGEIPEVDRRHKYIWEWEYRQAGVVRDSDIEVEKQRKVTSVTELSTFYGQQNRIVRGVSFVTCRHVVSSQRTLTEEDARMARRVVGYLEYGSALDHFNKLISMSGPEDLNAINKILFDRKEFTVYPNLPEEFKTLSSPKGHSQQPEVSIDGQLRFDWVVALARVEFGAIVAGFTPHPDPYEDTLPERFAYSQTMQLLLEGVASHHAGLDREQFSKMTGEPEQKIISILALIRRVRMARSMLRPLMQVEESHYSTIQTKQLAKTGEDLLIAQQTLATALKRYFELYQSRKDFAFRSKAFVEATELLLEAERRELKEGTAKVIKPESKSRYPKGGGK